MLWWPAVQERSSRSWFRRGSSYNSADKSDTKDSRSRSRSRSPSALSDMNREVDATETQALSSNVDDKSVKDGDENREEDSDAETTDEAVKKEIDAALADLKTLTERNWKTRYALQDDIAKVHVHVIDAMAQYEATIQ